MARLLLATALGGAMVVLAAQGARADTLRVGPGATHATPCAAFAVASDGDVVEIDAAGRYDGDVCAISRSRLTIRGVNGRARIDAAGAHSGGKAIWVIQGDDTLIEDVELSGCRVPDQNGAGIRQEGRNLTVRRGSFHDNQNGILVNAGAQSTVTIEDSEFAHNGHGDGQSHNIYVGEVASFVLRGSYSHHAKVGHLVKSRALRNEITYNRLGDEGGNASYQIDLPQGGPSYVIGNLLQKSASAENGAFISYARESKRNPDSALWVVGNTFVNERSAGTFVASAPDVSTLVLRNNVFAGPGIPTDHDGALEEANFSGDAGFVDPGRALFQLRADSPARDRGVAPGEGAGRSLVPLCQYAHPARATKRVQVDALDLGAFEHGGESTEPCHGAPAPSPDPPRDASVPPPPVPDGSVGPTLDAATGPEAGVDARVEGSARDDRAGDGGGCQISRGAASLPVLSLAAFLLALILRRRVG